MLNKLLHFVSGVMISHDNIRWCAFSAKSLVEMRTKKEVIISYLPLSHVAANLLDIWVAISGQATVYFADKMVLKVSSIFGKFASNEIMVFFLH